MPHETTPHLNPSQDLGNAAIAALCAIAIKAGDTAFARKPKEGWPAFAGIHPRSWRRAVLALVEAGLIAVDADTITLPEPYTTRWAEMGEREDRFVRVPLEILTVHPDARRAWLAALTLADFHRGSSLATMQTIGRRMGRSKPTAIDALDKLKRAGVYDRRSRRTWRVQTVPKNGRHGLIAYSWLADSFGFDFRPKSEIRQIMPNCCGHTPTVGRTHTDRRRTLTDQGRTHTDPYHDPLSDSFVMNHNHGNPVGLPADSLASAAVLAFPDEHQRQARRVMAHLFSRKRNEAEMYHLAKDRQSGRHRPGMFGSAA